MPTAIAFERQCFRFLAVSRSGKTRSFPVRSVALQKSSAFRSAVKKTSAGTLFPFALSSSARARVSLRTPVYRDPDDPGTFISLHGHTALRTVQVPRVMIMHGDRLIVSRGVIKRHAHANRVYFVFFFSFPSGPTVANALLYARGYGTRRGRRPRVSYAMPFHTAAFHHCRL